MGVINDKWIKEEIKSDFPKLYTDEDYEILKGYVVKICEETDMSEKDTITQLYNYINETFIYLDWVNGRLKKSDYVEEVK
tara:strand:+ start:440 stop:679 length:240 start_codon:yes stop_codon:yes gene_type:complete